MRATSCNRCHRRKCVCDKGAFATETVNKVVTVPVPGVKGDSPYIGDNGNWWVGEEDTGVSAQQMYKIAEW